MKKMVYFSVLWHLVRKLREYCTGVTYSMTILPVVIDVLLGSGFSDCFEHHGSKSQALFNPSASRSFLFVALIFVCMFYAVLAFKCSVISVIVMSITWFVFVLSLPPLTTGELGEMLLMLKLAIFLQMFNKLVWWEILSLF